MNLLDLKDEKSKTVTVRGYKFRVKYMTPRDRIQITQKRVALQNGNPIEAFTQDDFLFFENISIVDTCTEDMPESFNLNESCMNWDDVDLVNELAHEIRKHTLDLESKLKKNKPIDGGK